MPFDPNFASAFGGISLPQIDAQRRQNALGQLDLQATQQKVQGMMNPNATPEQLARSGNVAEANAVQQAQQVRQQNAMRYAGTRFLAGSQSQNPKEFAKQMAADPNFGAAVEAVGMPHPSQIDNFEGISDDQLRQQFGNLARILGATPPDYTLGEGQLRMSGMSNQQVAAGAPKQGTVPSGYRMKPDNSLEAIPGGPADKAAMGSLLTPEGKDLAAQEYLNTGKLPPGLGKASAGINAQIVSRAAEIARANGNDAQAASLGRAAFIASKSALGALTKQRTMVGAFERTALKNLEIAVEESQKVDRTGVPVINRWLLAGKKNLAGDVEVGRFHAALTSALNEYAKVLSGATGSAGISDAARREAESLISTANTPEQVIGIADIMKREMANRESGFAEQEAQLQETMTGRPAVPVAPASTAAPVAPGSSNAGQFPPTNAKGWVLHRDAKGNQAYVSPDGRQFEDAR